MRRLFVCTAVFALLCSPASAQTRMFLTGSVFGDLKQPSEQGDFLEHDNTAFGGGIRIGALFSDRWSVELGVDMGGDMSSQARYLPLLTAITAGYPTLFPDIGELPIPSIFPIYDFREETRLTTVSVLLGYHPSTNGRWHPGFAGGLTFVRESTKPVTTGFDTRVFSPEYVRNGPAATVAFELAIDFTPRLSVVPEVRAHAYDGTTVYRPGVALRLELR
jgi:hypothetical protein